MRTRQIGVAFMMIIAVMVTNALAQGKSSGQDQEVAKLLEALSRQEQAQPQADGSEAASSPQAGDQGPTIREIYRAAYTDAERAALGLDFNTSLNALKERVESGSADLARELSTVPDAAIKEPLSPQSPNGADAQAYQPVQKPATREQDQQVESGARNKGAAPVSPAVAAPMNERRTDQVGASQEENPFNTLWTRVVQLAERVGRLESAVKINRTESDLVE